MSENNLSMNQEVPVGLQTEQRIPKVTLESIDVYKSIVAGLRQQLIGLVQEGSMSESVAERVLSDFMYTVFNQVVKVRLDD